MGGLRGVAEKPGSPAAWPHRRWRRRRKRQWQPQCPRKLRSTRSWAEPLPAGLAELVGRAELGVRGTHTTLPQSPNGNERQMNRFYVQMKWQRERVLGAPKVGLRINKPLNIFLVSSPSRCCRCDEWLTEEDRPPCGEAGGKRASGKVP